MRADRSMPSRASCASTWPPTSPGRAARHRPWAATRPRTIACAAAAEMTALRVPQRVGLVLSPDDGAAVAARVVVRFHLRAFVRVEPAARAGEVEPVHQLRVATRRLRTALRLFAPLLPARFAAAARPRRPRSPAGRRRARPAPSPSARGRARGPPPRPGRGTSRPASPPHPGEATALRGRDAAQPGRPFGARGPRAPRAPAGHARQGSGRGHGDRLAARLRRDPRSSGRIVAARRGADPGAGAPCAQAAPARAQGLAPARAHPAPRERAQGAGGRGVPAAGGGARMMLYVLRHGVAEEVGPEGTDGSRRLTPGGRRKLRAAAAGVRGLGVAFDAILTSPLVRAGETAAIVAEALGNQPAPRELAALEPGVPPVETARALRAFARLEHVAIVGHEPGLSGVVALLLTGSPDGPRLVLKKGGLVALEVRDPGRGRGATLRCMLTPRQLRRLGR